MQALPLGHHEQAQELSTRWQGPPTARFNFAIIVIAAINLASALAMITYILFDARVLARSLRVQRVFHVHPAEVFPLIISVAIVVQGIISFVAQCLTFPTNSTPIQPKIYCEAFPQIIWPMLWIVPYTMLVFGLETTFRSLHPKRFIDRKWWAVLICVIAILIMVLVTWVPSYLNRNMDWYCSAIACDHGQWCISTIIGWTAPFANVGLVLGSCILFTYVVCATVITTKLIRTKSMDTGQRISATRAVYYLIASSWIMTLVIPFFAQTYLQKRAKQSARLAEIAVNLIGIVNLLLHIFLRSNAARAAIRPWKSSPSKERPLRVFGPSDLEMTMLITSPVLLEEEAERLHVNDNHNLADKLRGPSHPANNTDPIDKGIGPIPEHAQSSMSCDRLRRPPQDENDHPQIVVHPSPFPRRQNSSYSIFPTFRSAMLRNSTSTTFSQGSEEQSLQPPRSIFTLPSSHSRDMSQQTSATVQIGFRLSAFSDERSSPSSFRSSTTTNNNSLRLPLYARTHSAEASPSVSPLSAICRTRIPSTISTSGDSATLPWHIMSPSHLQNERLRRSILGHLSPRTRSRREVGSERLGSSTMKALPPDPPMEVRLKPSAEF